VGFVSFRRFRAVMVDWFLGGVQGRVSGCWGEWAWQGEVVMPFSEYSFYGYFCFIKVERNLFYFLLEFCSGLYSVFRRFSTEAFNFIMLRLNTFLEGRFAFAVR